MITNSYIVDNPNFDERKQNSTRMTEFFEKIPVICILNENIAEKPYYKFLVHKDTTLSSLVCTLRKNIKIDRTQSIFSMTETNILLTQGTCLNVLYNIYKNDDGFLYIHIRKENCFGCK